jgi:hypothetical protein
LGDGVCSPDVARLRAFVSGAQHDHDASAPLHIVDPVSGTIIYSHFVHARADAPGVSEISLFHSTDAGKNPCEGIVILQAAQPCLELVRLQDFNRGSK